MFKLFGEKGCTGSKCFNTVMFTDLQLNYYGSTIVRGEPVFKVFMGRSNNEIWFPTNSRFPLMCILKNSKPKIQESAYKSQPKYQSQSSISGMAHCVSILKRSIHFYSSYCPNMRKSICF